MTPNHYQLLLMCKITTLIKNTGWSFYHWKPDKVYYFKNYTNDEKENNKFQDIQETLHCLQRDGWHYFATSEFHSNDIKRDEEHGYMATCFYNKLTKQIVVAHRGTQFIKGNLVADIIIAKKEAPVILTECAFSFLNFIHEYNQHLHYEIIHTGFSLGGFLASGAAILSNHFFKNINTYEHNKAVCFDNPGIYNALKFLEENHPEHYKGITKTGNERNIEIYVTEPNLVNTCNKHYGVVKQIKNFSGKISEIVGLKEEALKNGFKLLIDKMHTLAILIHAKKFHEQDSLINLLSINQPNFEFLNISKWPEASMEFIFTDETPQKQIVKYKKFDITIDGFFYFFYECAARIENAIAEIAEEAIKFLFETTYNRHGDKKGAIAIDYKLDRRQLTISTAPAISIFKRNTSTTTTTTIEGPLDKEQEGIQLYYAMKISEQQM